MAYLLDTNLIIRFLVGDHDEHLKRSVEVFEKIESAEIEVVIPESVLMESFFVLVKFYKLPKSEVLNDLKTILSLNGVVNDDRIILFETLNILGNRNIDFVDALLCAKSRLQGYELLSLATDLRSC